MVANEYWQKWNDHVGLIVLCVHMMVYGNFMRPYDGIFDSLYVFI